MDHDAEDGGSLSRRDLLWRAAGLAALSVGTGAAPWTRSAAAAEPAANRMAPKEALKILVEGNGRYVRGETKIRDFSVTRAALAEKQAPHSVILGCSDSRVAPELAFDQGRGDLFIVRVAGNFINTDGLASIEYAVEFLGSSLVVVLGHSRCGALDSALKFVKEGAVLPGHLPDLVQQLRPAVDAAQLEAGDQLANAIRANVRLTVAKLEAAGPIVAELVAAGKVKVVGGIYDLATGKVDLLA